MAKILLLITNPSDASVMLDCFALTRHEIFGIGDRAYERVFKHSLMLKDFFTVEKGWLLDTEKTLEIIRKRAKACGAQVIFPTGFLSQKFLSRYRLEMSAYAKVVTLPHPDLIENLNNKHFFAEFCVSNGIPHPRTILVKSADQELLDLKHFPLLAKPIISSAGRGIEKIACKEEFSKMLKYLEENKKLPMLLQEFVEGRDACFNGFVEHGELVAWTIQLGIHIPRKGDSDLRWMEFSRHDKVFEISKKIISNSQYEGPINIDLRISPAGETFAIEVNPRFWATTFISNSDGVNFADVAVRRLFEPNLFVKPLYSSRIWGSPHRTVVLFLKQPSKTTFSYIFRHSPLQIIFYFFKKFNEMWIKLCNRTLSNQRC